jgi:hypothetical protein
MIHKIIISSPAGSGMNFALNLLRVAYDTLAIGKSHERKDIEEAVPQVVILRDPYDTISSGAERWIKSSNHGTFLNSEDLLEESDIDGIKTAIGWEEKRYFDFFKGIEELKHIKVISFDLLINDSKKFIVESGKHFGLVFDNKVVLDSDALAAVKLEGNSNRVPRETSDARQIINDLIDKMYSKEDWRCWKIYSDLKAQLDEKGL